VCPVCSSVGTGAFVEAVGLPAHVGALWSDAEGARGCVRGDIRLSHCAACGHLTNRRYDPSLLDYTQEYDNALHGSSVFRSFEAQLVRRLARDDLRGALVVEIGPGDGRFLSLLASAAECRGIGFEPGLASRSNVLADGRVEIRGDRFTADALDEAPRLICCRQVLEHIDEPRVLLQELHRALSDSPGSRAYVEVPNTALLLEDLSIWDLVYEHCQYFVSDSLAALFEIEGFEILDAWASYESQFLSIEVAASPASGGHAQADRPDRTDRLRAISQQVDRFASRFAEKTAWWRDHLAELTGSGRRTVLWGGGARAVTFANLVAPDTGLDLIVDVNPAKQGTFLAGTGHEIHSPDALLDARPDVVVVLNPIYLDEIRGQLAAMGLDPLVETT
jgi:SAM-dependent methyltransferase